MAAAVAVAKDCVDEAVAKEKQTVKAKARWGGGAKSCEKTVTPIDCRLHSDAMGVVGGGGGARGEESE